MKCCCSSPCDTFVAVWSRVPNFKIIEDFEWHAKGQEVRFHSKLYECCFLNDVFNSIFSHCIERLAEIRSLKDVEPHLKHILGDCFQYVLTSCQ